MHKVGLVSLLLILSISLIYCSKIEHEEQASPNYQVNLLKEDVWEGFQKKNYAISTFESNITLDLLLPHQTTSAPYPIVLLLHGATASKSQWTVLNTPESAGHITKKLLEADIAVAAMDLPLHGDRINPKTKEVDMFNLLSMYHKEFYPKATRDIRVVFEFIKNNHLFSSSKTGLMGYSMGGILALGYAGKDRTITALVTGSPPIPQKPFPLPYHLQPWNNIHHTAILHLAATQDEWYTREEAVAFFNQIPTSKKTQIFYNSGHQLPAQHIDEVANWFILYLKDS